MSEQAKADWREMEAGRALDRVVAERLGWRIAQGTNTDREWWVAEREGTQDFELIVEIEYCDSIDAAWEHALTVREDIGALLPRYSTDANAALPLERGEVFVMEQDWTGHGSAMIVQTLNGNSSEILIANTIAEARAKAWLSWKDAQ